MISREWSFHSVIYALEFQFCLMDPTPLSWFLIFGQLPMKTYWLKHRRGSHSPESDHDLEDECNSSDSDLGNEDDLDDFIDVANNGTIMPLSELEASLDTVVVQIL